MRADEYLHRARSYLARVERSAVAAWQRNRERRSRAAGGSSSMRALHHTPTSPIPSNLGERLDAVGQRCGWTENGKRFPHTRLRRIVQIIADLSDKPLDQCRIIDLGCLDGQFSIEFALHGARVVGIDARKANIERAQRAQKMLGVTNVDFSVRDVREVDRRSFGAFDFVICSGLLYHLNTPDVFDVIRNIHEMSERAAIFDTHVSLQPKVDVEHAGRRYSGQVVPEHAVHATSSEMEDKLWHSYGNRESFWFSRPALVNALSHAGFSSVYECFNPAHLNFGEPGIEHRDRCTFLAIKGATARVHTSPACEGHAEDWPDGSLRY